uniref:Uncharacterized protein n=1 Tax=Arundo donax TaxID=35708 RepID=A0A0A9ER49_ARUDO
MRSRHRSTISLPTARKAITPKLDQLFITRSIVCKQFQERKAVDNLLV